MTPRSFKHLDLAALVLASVGAGCTQSGVMSEGGTDGGGMDVVRADVGDMDAAHADVVGMDAAHADGSDVGLADSSDVVHTDARDVVHADGGVARARFEPPNGTTYLGVGVDYDSLGAFETASGITTHPAIFQGYPTAFQTLLDRVLTLPGVTPLISWNVPMRDRQVLDGSHDGYIATQVTAARTYGRPIFLRPDWEMNGTWSPNYDSTTTTPSDYIASWRYIHDFFRDVSNVAFVWCPNEGQPNTGHVDISTWYPGDAYVDWICLDVYPEYGTPPHDHLLTDPDGLDAFAAYAAAHHKPLMVGEWARGSASYPPDTIDPYRMIFDWAERYPDTVKALVYFDFTGPRDHLLETHPIGAAYYRSRTVGNARYLLDVVP